MSFSNQTPLSGAAAGSSPGWPGAVPSRFCTDPALRPCFPVHTIAVSGPPGAGGRAPGPRGAPPLLWRAARGRVLRLTLCCRAPGSGLRGQLCQVGRLPCLGAGRGGRLCPGPRPRPRPGSAGPFLPGPPGLRRAGRQPRPVCWGPCGLGVPGLFPALALEPPCLPWLPTTGLPSGRPWPRPQERSAGAGRCLLLSAVSTARLLPLSDLRPSTGLASCCRLCPLSPFSKRIPGCSSQHVGSPISLALGILGLCPPHAALSLLI